MNNKTWLDKEKLEDYLSKKKRWHDGGYADALDAIESEIESGTLDAPIDYERVHISHLIRAMEEANQLREENAKLVKALEWYAGDGHKVAQLILSELKGREHQ